MICVTWPALMVKSVAGSQGTWLEIMGDQIFDR